MGLPPAHLLAFKPGATWWCKEGVQRHRRLLGDKQQVLSTKRHRLPLSCWPHTHGSKDSWSPVQAVPLSSRDGHLSTAHTRSPRVTNVRTDEHTSKPSTNLGKLHFQNINLCVCLYMHVHIYIFFNRNTLVRNVPNYQIIQFSSVQSLSCVWLPLVIYKVMRYR